MADKIYNIGDFKKDENGSEKANMSFSQNTINRRTPYVRPDEMNPDDIQIEDPMNFLTSEEKQEYIKAHQETILRNESVKAVRQRIDSQRNAQYQGQRVASQASYRNDRSHSYGNGYQDQQQNGYGRAGYVNQAGNGYQGDYYDESSDDYYEDYDQNGYYNDQQGYMDDTYQDQADYQEYEEEMESGDDKMAIITKILAAVTAILIIIIAAMFLYNKINDPATEAESGDEFAYTGDDTVSEESNSQNGEQVTGTTVYTTNDLNLRTSPEKTDTNKAMTVKEGTELILAGEENGWAKVYYQGQYYYCSKEYLSETK